MGHDEILGLLIGAENCSENIKIPLDDDFSHPRLPLGCSILGIESMPRLLAIISFQYLICTISDPFKIMLGRMSSKFELDRGSAFCYAMYGGSTSFDSTSSSFDSSSSVTNSASGSDRIPLSALQGPSPILNSDVKEVPQASSSSSKKRAIEIRVNVGPIWRCAELAKPITGFLTPKSILPRMPTWRSGRRNTIQILQSFVLELLHRT